MITLLMTLMQGPRGSKTDDVDRGSILAPHLFVADVTAEPTWLLAREPAPVPAPAVGRRIFRPLAEGRPRFMLPTQKFEGDFSLHRFHDLHTRQAEAKLLSSSHIDFFVARAPFSPNSRAARCEPPELSPLALQSSTARLPVPRRL
jgi:hypothetical protein